MTAQTTSQKNPSVRRKIPDNQAELLQEYKRAYEQLKPKSLRTILELREQFRKRGMVI